MTRCTASQSFRAARPGGGSDESVGSPRNGPDHLHLYLVYREQTPIIKLSNLVGNQNNTLSAYTI